MNLINLTPHRIDIHDDDLGRTHLISLSAGSVEPARVAVAKERESTALVPVDYTDDGSVSQAAIPVFKAAYGELQNLPEPREGYIYVVSMLVHQAALELGRTDTTYPGEPIRDENGVITGCIGLNR